MVEHQALESDWVDLSGTSPGYRYEGLHTPSRSPLSGTSLTVRDCEPRSFTGFLGVLSRLCVFVVLVVLILPRGILFCDAL